jgi:hypothetical protein
MTRIKQDYVQECSSLYEGAEEMMDGIRDVLESPACTGMILVCCARTGGDGFTRFVCGGKNLSQIAEKLLESIPVILAKTRQLGDRRAAKGSKTTH